MGSLRWHTALWAPAACLLVSCPILQASDRGASDLHVENLAPKFLKFYAAAASASVTEPQRWALWRKDYGIAAVPPTPAGLALARKQLDEEWSRYGKLLPTVNGREESAERDAREVLPRVKALLGAGAASTPVDLVLFVGQFDGNEFTVPPRRPGDPPTVVMPIETHDIRYALTQELMHAVQIDMAGLHNGFNAPLGETVLTVGVAMRGTERILPGAPKSLYTWRSAPWLARCMRDSDAILRGIRPYIAKADADTTTRFTYGRGTTGLKSEAYCAGWILAGNLLEHGYTFRRLAKIPEADMPRFVTASLNSMLGGTGRAPSPATLSPSKTQRP